MERWCFIETKTFVFSVVEGASVVRLAERRSFSGLVLLGAQSIVWLALTMEISCGTRGIRSLSSLLGKGQRFSLLGEAVI
jgi:hypothetical protein